MTGPKPIDTILAPGGDRVRWAKRPPKRPIELPRRVAYIPTDAPKPPIPVTKCPPGIAWGATNGAISQATYGDGGIGRHWKPDKDGTRRKSPGRPRKRLP